MRLDHVGDDGFDLVRQRAAVGVAQHDPARALFVRGLGAGQRVGGIRLVAVEEVLAVEQHLPALGLCRAHAVADRGEVLVECGLERDLDVIVPGLGDEADRLGLGLEQRAEARIVEAERPGRRVMPKAVNVAPISRLSENSCVSVRLAPG